MIETNAKPKKIIVLMGLPGSGKGTQATDLAKEFDAEIIGTGELIRLELAKNNDGDSFYDKLKERYLDGVPQPDEVIFKLVTDKLEHLDKNVVFDNFPFSSAQVQLLEEFIKTAKWEEPLVIYLKISPETSVKRIVYRKVCPDCGAVYAGLELSTCKSCGNALITRADDNEETARKRIDFYFPRIQEVIAEFHQYGRVIEINGEPPAEDVSRSVTNALNKFHAIK